MDCHFTTYGTANSCRLFGHIQFDHHCRDVLVVLRTAFLEHVKMLGLHDIICLAVCDTLLCLLAIRRSQEIDRSR